MVLWKTRATPIPVTVGTLEARHKPKGTKVGLYKNPLTIYSSRNGVIVFFLVIVFWCFGCMHVHGVSAVQTVQKS